MSLMKLGKIPEGQNDMIIAINANDIMDSIIVIGMMIHIGVQTFFNIAVTLNVLPNTGIGLPFISYGGTSILC